MVKNPEYFLGKNPESGFIDPDNPYILTDHLKCAVFELPFKAGEKFGRASADEVLAYLEESGVVRKSGGTSYWADRAYPAEGVSLRSASSENIVIIDITKGRNSVIGEMDRPSAKELIFPKAVYLHRGVQYAVKDFDLEERRCYVEESKLNYYTDAIVKRDIKVLQEDERSDERAYCRSLGDILVRSQVTKFKKIRFHSHENVGYGDISLPEEEMHTRALVVRFPKECLSGALLADMNDVEKTRIIVSLGNLVRQIAPVYLLCDSRDVGVSERLRDPHFEEPCLFFFDMYPGGTGLA
jgi:DEAD/DEAH box helicase domain-containing protein